MERFIKELNSLSGIKVTRFRKALPEEYEYGGKRITELLKKKLEEMKLGEDDLFIDYFTDNVAGYLEKPLIFSKIIYDKERMLKLKRSHPDLHDLLFYSRNDIRNLVMVSGYVQELFQDQYHTFITRCHNIQGALRKACAKQNDEEVERYTLEATNVIRDWCIKFITAPH